MLTTKVVFTKNMTRIIPNRLRIRLPLNFNCSPFRLLIRFLPPSLLKILTHQLLSLFLHHLHTNRSVLLSVYLLSSLNYRVVFTHNILVLNRKNLLKTTQMFILIFISQPLRLSQHLFPLLPLIYLPFSCQQSRLVEFFGAIKQLLLCLHINIHNSEGVLDKAKLYLLVKWSVRSKTRSVIHLQKHRLSLRIQHNVQPKNMKTHTPGIVLRLRTSILVTHQRQTTNNSLYSHIIYLCFKILDIQTPRCQLLKNAGKRTFVPHTHIASTIIEHKLRTILIYRIVSQVHVLMVEISTSRLHVLLGSQSSQPFVINVQSHWVRPTKQHIDSQVKFQTLQKIWPR